MPFVHKWPHISSQVLIKPSHIFTHPDMASQAFTHPVESLTNLKCPLVLPSRASPPRSRGARLLSKTDGPDNTIGLVPAASVYVFNTLQTNSAAHVPNANTNPVNEDTSNIGVAPPNADASARHSKIVEPTQKFTILL